MLTPVNYVDLFDRLYPEQHLVGLTDENQITVEELNRRYASIRANQRTAMLALNSVYSAQPNGSHFRDYMLPFWEVAACRRWELSTADVALLRHRNGFDPGGLELNFPEPRTSLHLHDLGSSLIDGHHEVLVFARGALLPSRDRHVHASQGGFSVYPKEDRIFSKQYSELDFREMADPDGSDTWSTLDVRDDRAHLTDAFHTIRLTGGVIDGRDGVTFPVTNVADYQVVLLRKFNERGVTYDAPPVFRNNAGATDGVFDIIVPDLGALGNVYDIRYYRLFSRLSTDSYFRPVPKEDWAARMEPSMNGAALFTVLRGAADGEEFCVTCGADFWKFEYDGPVTETSELYKVDLVHPDGLPLGVWDVEDLDVWIDGRLQRPYVDYWIEWGGPASADQPPRLIYREIPIGARHSVFILHNAPHDPELSLTIREPETLSTTDGVYRLPAAERALRLVRDVGLVFSGGFLHRAGDGINVVADNLGLHLEDLPYNTDLSFRSRFVLTPGGLTGALRESDHETALEQFIGLVGLKADGSSSDGASPLGFDFIESYRQTHNVHPIPNAPAPERPVTRFGAMFFWVRDESVSAGDFVLDFREGADLSTLNPWRQGSDPLILDGRDAAHTSDYVSNITLDARAS